MAVCIETAKRYSLDDYRTPVFIFERLCSIIYPVGAARGPPGPTQPSAWLAGWVGGRRAAPAVAGQALGSFWSPLSPAAAAAARWAGRLACLQLLPALAAFQEENEVTEFFVTLEKDPQQEDFLQGRMPGNPYSSNEPGIGPLMRDIKNKICQDCDLVALLEDDSGMEVSLCASRRRGGAEAGGGGSLSGQAGIHQMLPDWKRGVPAGRAVQEGRLRRPLAATSA